MVDYSNIENILIKLDTLYNGTSDSLEQVLYSKLAILEYCGWLEDSFDEIANNYIARKISSSNHSFVKNKFILKNHGFSYDNNIRPMFAPILGFHVLEWIENFIDSSGGRFTLMRTYIDYFLSERREAAHCVTGATTTYQAPSIALTQFRRLKPILADFEYCVQSI